MALKEARAGDLLLTNRVHKEYHIHNNPSNVLYKSLYHSAVVVFTNKYGIMPILRVIIINIITHVYVWLHIYDTANGACNICACLHI